LASFLAAVGQLSQLAKLCLVHRDVCCVCDVSGKCERVVMSGARYSSQHDGVRRLSAPYQRRM